MRLFLAIAVLCAGSAASFNGGSAAAQPSHDPVGTERISSADLNLHLARDQERLKARISFAAYRLCLVDAPASPSPAIADPQCRRAAMIGALQQMDQVIARATASPRLASSAAGVTITGR